jgi:hypothetical protein
VPLSNFVPRGFEFVHHSIAILYHEVPNPNLTIRNFFITVGCALDGVAAALVGWHLMSPAACERGAPGGVRLAAQLLSLPGVWAAAPALRPHMARYDVASSPSTARFWSGVGD